MKYRVMFYEMGDGGVHCLIIDSFEIDNDGCPFPLFRGFTGFSEQDKVLKVLFPADRLLSVIRVEATA